VSGLTLFNAVIRLLMKLFLSAEKIVRWRSLDNAFVLLWMVLVEREMASFVPGMV
jgi:hypothetical protein